jgi:hypothetical protein
MKKRVAVEVVGVVVEPMFQIRLVVRLYFDQTLRTCFQIELTPKIHSVDFKYNKKYFF